MMGCDVDKAQNGMEAFNLVKSRLEKVIQGSSKEPMYNLIIMDINMPILNGLDACAFIKALFSEKISDKFESEN